MIGDGKMFLYEILISSYQKVLLQKSTAVYTIRAVDECQTEQRWLTALFSALSIIGMISWKSTAVYTIRAVNEYQTEQRWLTALFSALSIIGMISWKSTAL